ncbi:sterol desaturase family protein [Sphingomonas abietis]|uniref:Sterol desaturase family protein n=1 Tax=Sphingomonas abietis TaxID=3012344 RepID=A0ABY7NUA9_9SPHN|nr:sterol desaturase family protein [Sphingomonas abietis]WBO23046.1 sterol desaturase family protein [Sphingomonas abietis]
MPAPSPGPQRVRLFKNERLERLSLISARTFALGWIVMLPLVAWVGCYRTRPLDAPLETLGFLVVGLLIWSVFEYAMHRYLFHFESDSPGVQWLVYLIHGNHHDSPNDPLRGLMPLPVSIAVMGLAWLAFVATLGAQGTWPALGFMLGYVIYDAVHYSCHQFSMRGKLGSALKHHHMRHHYAKTTGNYAISAIFWDRVFGSRITSLKGPDRTA